MSGVGVSRAVGAQATGELMRRGFTRLESLFAGYVANFGDNNFQTYSRIAIQRDMRRPDGRPYHPESIGRVARKLARDGVVKISRVQAGHKIPNVNARWRSSHGTTCKAFNWAVIQRKNPFSRRERRQRRQAEAIALRQVGDLVVAPSSPRPDRPRYSAPAPVPMDPIVAKLAAEAQEAQERRASRAPSASSSPSSSPPEPSSASSSPSSSPPERSPP